MLRYLVSSRVLSTENSPCAVISLQQRQMSFSSEYTEVKERLTGTYNFLKTKCLMESISLPMDSEQINTVYQEAIRKSHERRSDLSDS